MLKLNKKLSTKTFVISQTLILLFSLILIGILYYILNPTTFKPVKPYSISSNTVTSVPASLTLDINSPDDNSISFDPIILITGKTGPGLDVLISSELNDLVIASKTDGTFSTNFNLQLGVNNIQMEAFDKSGDSRSASRTVYYSKEKLP